MGVLNAFVFDEPLLISDESLLISHGQMVKVMDARVNGLRFNPTHPSNKKPPPLQSPFDILLSRDFFDKVTLSCTNITL